MFNAIRAAALRSVQIEIVQNLPTVTHPNTDSILLQEEFPHIVHVLVYSICLSRLIVCTGDVSRLRERHDQWDNWDQAADR